jgi:hypothetical protein
MIHALTIHSHMQSNRTETDSTAASAQRSGEAGHEKRDGSVRSIALTVGAFIVVGLVLHFALAGLQWAFKKETAREDRKIGGFVAEPAIAAERVHFPEPNLQVQPRADLQSFRAREEAELNSYGWINKTAGVVRIPVSRAMDLLAERGLPVRGTNGGVSDLELIRNRMNQK